MTREPWLGFRAPKPVPIHVDALPPADEPPDGLPVVYWRPLRCPRCGNRGTESPEGHGRKGKGLTVLVRRCAECHRLQNRKSKGNAVVGKRTVFRYQLCQDCGCRFKSMEIDEGT